jgi:hypothetical protein
MSKHPGRTAFLGILHSNRPSRTTLAPPSLSPSRTPPDRDPSLFSCVDSTSSTAEKPERRAGSIRTWPPHRAASIHAGRLDSRRGVAGGAGARRRRAERLDSSSQSSVPAGGGAGGESRCFSEGPRSGRREKRVRRPTGTEMGTAALLSIEIREQWALPGLLLLAR